jgi:hypothetical protein
MLFKDILAGRYRVFARMNDEEKSRNIGVVKYIETLASMAGVNISEWDCMELFRQGKSGNKLIDDRNEINRLFFAEVEKLASSIPATAISDVFNDEMRQAIRAIEARHVADLLASEQRKAEHQLQYAMTRYRDYETCLKKAGEHFAAAHRLGQVSIGIEQQIALVASGQFWEFVGISDRANITFVTRADIIVAHSNPAAGIDIRLNFGRYKAVFDVSNFSMKVFGFERNISSAGYIHPHISTSGNICWGNASNTASRLLVDRQFVEPMTLLATILSNYNASNPYRPIERFQEEVGTPEEHEAEGLQRERHAEVRAIMAPVDQMELNVDLHQEPIAPPPEAAALVNPEPSSIAQEGMPPSAVPRRGAAVPAAAAQEHDSLPF